MKNIFKYIIATLALSIYSYGNAETSIKPIKLWENDTLSTEITIYKANSKESTGMGVVVCPGGSYAFVSMSNEGDPVGEWLANNGITAIVLKYRLHEGDRSRPINDAREALRFMRRNAKSLNVDVNKIGIWGSSAGGHLASTISTHIEDSLSHPNFTVLYYPAISSRDDLRHKRSFKNFLGKNESKQEMADYSNELHVDKNTPPTLFILADDDKTVNPINSIVYYQALKRYNIPSALYVFPEGNHGFGFKDDWSYQSLSRELIIRWLHNFNRK